MSKKIKEYKLGIDIGGTKMLAVLFDGERVVEDYVLATPKDSVEHFIIMINALVEPLFEKAKKDKAQVNGIGLGIAGVVDFKSRKVLVSPNIEIIENTNFVYQLEKKLGQPIFIDNDANCFLRAEVKIGAARKSSNAYGVIVGTGIGSAWWYEDNIYMRAGEIGNNIVDFESKITLEKAYQNLTQRNPLNMSTEAYKGDILAIKSFEEFGTIFGLTMSNLVNTIAPDIIVVGGGGVGASDLFFPEAKKIMKEYIHIEENKKTKLVVSKLGSHAGAIGAAMLVE
ncbi:MAG: ROK family protein [Patescibacteria group bacterium]|jgi:predicted NBD/HSP70 family sugar kinase|nr:ROK family protein [Patescibacteria group bacterium]